MGWLQRPWVAGGLVAATVAILGLIFTLWWPIIPQWVDAAATSLRGQNEESPSAISHGDHDHSDHDHSGHDHGDHDHSAHDDHEHSDADQRDPAAAAVATLTLTRQARANLGLTPEFLRPVELTDYRRTITMPAVISPQPGRSQIVVSSPLSGVITHVHAVTGEAVHPGDLLFEVRLTYEELVDTQTKYLQTVNELEVENREIARLEAVTQSGAVSGKSLLERRYAKEKLEALLTSQREALRLHGLSDRQIEVIAADGRLLRDLRVVAPDVDRHDHPEESELQLSQNAFRSIAFQDDHPPVAAPSHVEQEPLVVDDLQVHKGQAVVTGERLCVLSDYSKLFIEAHAFEHDLAAINRAVEKGWTVDAEFPSAEERQQLTELKLAFIANSIDPDTRTLAVYVELPNEIVRDERNSEGQRFITWKYRIGQRLELQIPVEQWEDQIVLPLEALVRDGVDSFVFRQDGAHFDRIPVHVIYRDQTTAVIANDASLKPGDIVAFKSAHQMQLAIRNRSGGAIDPHAGHSH